MSSRSHQTSLKPFVPDDARDRLNTWIPRMVMLDQAGRGYTNIIKQMADDWGAKYGTIVRMFKGWQKHGEVALLDMRKCAKYVEGAAVRGLPPLFEQHWIGRVESATRGQTLKQVHKLIMDELAQWRRGSKQHAIPGYDTPPKNQPGKKHPVGWSYARLVRLLKDKRPELALARLGRQALKQYLPKIFTTRVGLEPGELLIPDDDHWDITVLWNNKQAARPIALDIIDVASACELMDGVMGRFETADGGKVHLREDYTFWLFLAQFERHGYRADRGTTVLQEAGTAKVRSELAERFTSATDGKIRFQTGKTDRRALRGMVFEGKAKGNPRFKTFREGLNALIRTYGSLLPAPTGPHRDAAPEEQAALIRYTEKLIKQVPAERHHLLRLPMLTEEQFHQVRMDLKAALNLRDEHEMEGWVESGYMKQVFRHPQWPEDHWQPFEKLQELMLKLSPEEAADIARQIELHDGELVKTQRMSPAEVWAAHAHKLTRLQIWQRHLIIPASMAFRATVRDDRQIWVKHEGQVWRWDAMCHSPQGHEIHLRPGNEIMIYVNPLDPIEALFTTVELAAIGRATQIFTPTRLDPEGFLQRAAHRQHVEAIISTPVAHRAAAKAEERAEMIKHNERVVKGLPVTPEEHAQAAEDRRIERAAAKIYDVEPEPGTPGATPLQPSADPHDAEAAVDALFDQ